jgi:glycosyltransferase involved in cell wall biosynthesis
MTSVVIAAHNEAAVIDRCLEALLAPGGPADLDVTVVANGCSDDTAARAAAHPGVRVVDLAKAGKAGALNAGDRVAVGFPRIYLDADIEISAPDLRMVTERLSMDSERVQVAVPGRRLDVNGRQLMVRAYYAIQARLPAFRDGLFGRGVVALSASGRARFDAFPDQVADDLFLDSLFSADERVTVVEAVSTVATPVYTRELVRRLVRVRRGNADLRNSGREVSAPATRVRPADRLSWLRDVVLPRPWLAPAGACYAAITLYAALSARRSTTTGWQRDESSRRPQETR